MSPDLPRHGNSTAVLGFGVSHSWVHVLVRALPSCGPSRLTPVSVSFFARVSSGYRPHVHTERVSEESAGGGLSHGVAHHSVNAAAGFRVSVTQALRMSGDGHALQAETPRCLLRSLPRGVDLPPEAA